MRFSNLNRKVTLDYSRYKKLVFSQTSILRILIDQTKLVFEDTSEAELLLTSSFETIRNSFIEDQENIDKINNLEAEILILDRFNFSIISSEETLEFWLDEQLKFITPFQPILKSISLNLNGLLNHAIN